MRFVDAIGGLELSAILEITHELHTHSQDLRRPSRRHLLADLHDCGLQEPAGVVQDIQ